MKPLDVLIAVTVPVVWGMGIVVAKPAVADFPPILLMSMRFFVTAAMLVWFVRVPRHALRSIFWVALVGSAVQYGLTFNGLRYLDAGATALIVQSEVPFCTLIAAVWLGERMGARKIVGMVIAFVGIYLILGEPRIQGQLIGVALVLGGAFTWAVGQVMMRKLGELGGFTAIAWISMFAAPQLLGASLVLERDHWRHLAEADWQLWGALMYLGVIMNVVGYSCWYHVLGRYEVNRVAPYLLLLPISAVCGGVLFLGERLTPLIVIGGLVVISGVAMIVWDRSAPNPGTPSGGRDER